jgi:type I restriction enzyme S subunit
MNVAERDYCIGRGLAAFVAKSGRSDTTFLKHAVEIGLPWLHRRSQGSTFAAISSEDLRRTPIPAIALVEQQRIATILTSLDNAIEATEALIEKHQQIKAGLMHDLFTRGLCERGSLREQPQVAREEFVPTPLGPMPAAWRPSTVGDEFDIDSGITLGPHRRPLQNASPYLRVANVYRDDLRLDDIAYIESMAGDQACVLRQGDLLVVEGHANPAEIGRCAMVNEVAEGMLFQNHLFRLRAKFVSSEFALLWLNSFHVQRYWRRACSTSSGLNTINRRMLSAVPIYLPPSGEQARIVLMASAARRRIEADQALLDKLHAQKQGLMQDLLTGKVPVKLADAVPEPAIV